MFIKNILKRLEITDKQSFWRFFWQIFKFSLVGLTNTALYLLIYQVIVTFLPGAYILANTVGWIISVVSSYLLNRRFVFKDSEVTFFIGLLKCYVTYLVGLALSTLLLVLWIEVVGISERVAPLINVVITMPVNFLMNKFFTFRSQKKKGNGMILVTGAAGQLGTDVVKELKKRSIENKGTDIVADSNVVALDITDEKAVREYLTANKPKTIIHCAAYTAVDKAEDEPELCHKVNAEGTENIARICKEIDAEMIYISTDYVFDGKGDLPYETDALKAPISTYGKSKLAGEEAVLKYLEKYYIVRISWVFGESGSNFVKTMLKLAETRDELNVVSDQIGSPTYTPDLAILLCDMAQSKKHGIYHATNEGFCSWAELATEIMQQSENQCKINPITTEQYPTKATRPKNSRLSKTSLDQAGFSRLPAWQDALKRFL